MDPEARALLSSEIMTLQAALIHGLTEAPQVNPTHKSTIQSASPGAPEEPNATATGLTTNDEGSDAVKYDGASVAPNPWPPIPDLTDIPGAELRKLPEGDIKENEIYGQVYSNTFRELQIGNDQHERFYDGVIRVIRNKHPEEIKRGTEASLKQLTDLTLRGFGYIVWKEGSTWLIPADELDEDEVRLVHVRGAGIENADNARFYPLFRDLWILMRNLMFEHRGPPRRQRRATQRPRARRQTRREREESPYLADADSDFSPPPPAPKMSDSQRNQVKSARRQDNLEDMIGTALAENRMLTAEETGKAILDLTVRLSKIRTRSDPDSFATLWEEHIMRIEEIDAAVEANGQAYTTEAEAPIFNGGVAPTQFGSSQANEPWNGNGNPLGPVFPDANMVQPVRPAEMSVYITVQHLSSLALLPENLNAMFNPTAAASRPAQQAYHWPDAPVEELEITRFFAGVNRRINDKTDKILGYIFSYGWNDTLRFVSTGRFECRALAKEDENGSPDAMDVNGFPIYKKTKRPRPQAKKPNGSGLVDFHEAQYEFLGMGWRQLQEDLDYAARNGVRVYRMKVGVVALAPTPNT
ncbi:hypothetical protein A1O1_07674 [Capronia coronata CBS 617.96]|uniref:Uncharacterized protein n=1 Tax=Capronia coronata CBS 617.96 TaxID=1182541 RepID=W9YH43_9EURO|nr:uncharacterized protein A1O1_07674 [Capronia coronata CBS 617.96]EXJ81609.1 hypothetical protein A1O1_07674 [Capronia coronata CBS 617.96]